MGNPGSVDVDTVRCKGCDQARLTKIVSEGHCELGTPTQDCTITHFACHIHKCNACSDPALKAKCCESCLTQMCGKLETHFPTMKPGGVAQWSLAAPAVTLCQGCETVAATSTVTAKGAGFFFR